MCVCVIMEPHLTATGCNLSYGSHSVTCHLIKWTYPALTPTTQSGTRFTYPGGMEGWVDLSDWLHTEMVFWEHTCLRLLLKTWPKPLQRLGFEQVLCKIKFYWHKTCSNQVFEQILTIEVVKFRLKQAAVGTNGCIINRSGEFIPTCLTHARYGTCLHTSRVGWRQLSRDFAENIRDSDDQ